MTQEKWLPRTTPFPNRLLDDVMPKLRDTELRVLAVIVRQTLGWRDPVTGKRKRVDWVTQSQFKRKTGRESAAISRAVEVLVKSGIIEAMDREGNPLSTALLRRRHRRQVFYCLKKEWLP